VSIFGLPTKHLENMAQRRRTVLCFIHVKGANATDVVCYDRRARSALCVVVRSEQPYGIFELHAFCEDWRHEKRSVLFSLS